MGAEPLIAAGGAGLAQPPTMHHTPRKNRLRAAFGMVPVP